ncbi:MAG: hypothetical protein IJ991_12095 [Thermoguttaceae bacterium]|nr:hypothetical protein [Thermoguttaceae bacterium]
MKISTVKKDFMRNATSMNAQKAARGRRLRRYLHQGPGVLSYLSDGFGALSPQILSRLSLYRPAQRADR